MTAGLDTWEVAERLYHGRGQEVSPNRPLFTGDVLDDVLIPGVQDGGLAMIVAHPCSMRGGTGQLKEQLLMAKVAPHPPDRAHRWTSGFYDRMPLPDLLADAGSFHVTWLDQLGRAGREVIVRAQRVASLSHVGVNMLQQRMVCCLTRVEIPTSTFWEAFAHTYEEVELLEEWNERLEGQANPNELAAQFEQWLQVDDHQLRLRDPQQRAPVRSEMRSELTRRRTLGEGP